MEQECWPKPHRQPAQALTDNSTDRVSVCSWRTSLMSSHGSATYLLNAAANGFPSVMTRRIIQGQQTNCLPAHAADGAIGTTLSHTQSTETTASVLCDPLSSRLGDLACVVSFLDDNLQVSPHDSSENDSTMLQRPLHATSVWMWKSDTPHTAYATDDKAADQRSS